MVTVIAIVVAKAVTIITKPLTESIMLNYIPYKELRIGRRQTEVVTQGTSED